MTQVRIAATPWLRTGAELRALRALVGAPHRVLGAVAGPSLAPELTGRLPTPPSLAALLHALRGRLIVTNPCAAARLPPVVAPLLRATLRRALGIDGDDVALDGALDGALDAIPDVTHDAARDAARDRTPLRPPRLGDARDAADARRLRALLALLPDATRDALSAGTAAWGAAALYEPTRLDVRFVDLPTRPAAPAPHPLVAIAPYRLALVVGAGDAPARWDAIDTAATSAPAVHWPPSQSAEPVAWFSVRVLVPDAVAAQSMEPETLARWGAITGRAGPSSRDAYWFADTWERFREPGRRVGYVTPAEIARSRRAAPPPPPPARDEAAWFVPAVAQALTPAAERGVCVPPGYALVDCHGTLELAVVVVQ